MSFYFYENWQANGKQAKIHKGECAHCNYGEGQRKEKTNNNGKWHGQFNSFEDAMNNAQLLNNYVITCCGICKPQ